jgi:hypothetical protein
MGSRKEMIKTEGRKLCWTIIIIIIMKMIIRNNNDSNTSGGDNNNNVGGTCSTWKRREISCTWKSSSEN